MVMQRVTTLISRDISDYLTNQKTWGEIIYNVLEHGLKGDGTTDDTAALQTLINTAIAAGRKSICFPHTATGGQYKVTALTNADQVFFFGDNASFIGGYIPQITQFGETVVVPDGTVTYVKLNPAPASAATPSVIMQRDANGRSKVVAPSASDDIAIKQTVDDHAALTNAHSSTSAATASRIVIRDASARAQFADPSAAQDAATKTYVDTEIAAATSNVIGTYTGDGTASRNIALSFTPSAVLVVARNGDMRTAGGTMYGGLAVTGSDVNSGTQSALAVATNAFTVIMNGTAATNQNTAVYHYIAFK